jgi:histidinol-phosphatase
VTGSFRAPGAGTPLSGWLALALELCDEADALALAHFRRDLRIETKPDRSFVTEADQAIEAAIRRRIEADYPDHGLVGEEYGEDRGSATRRWYIDPIDATHNFIRGIPIFGTLLALEDGGEIVLGLMSAPALACRWLAWRGGGAWALDRAGERAAGLPNARRLHVSGIGRVEDAQLLYSPRDRGESPTMAPGLEATLSTAWRTRGFGDFWSYALVAEGAAEGMVEEGMHSWDLAAPLVIVEEAGGQLTDLNGNRTIHGRGALASNGRLHDALLLSLTKGAEGHESA